MCQIRSCDLKVIETAADKLLPAIHFCLSEENEISITDLYQQNVRKNFIQRKYSA